MLLQKLLRTVLHTEPSIVNVVNLFGIPCAKLKHSVLLTVLSSSFSIKGTQSLMCPPACVCLCMHGTVCVCVWTSEEVVHDEAVCGLKTKAVKSLHINNRTTESSVPSGYKHRTTRADILQSSIKPDGDKGAFREEKHLAAKVVCDD